MMRSKTHPRRRLMRPSEADIAYAQLSRGDGSSEGVNRRRFLQGALATGGAVGMMPGVFDSIAAAATPLAPTDRVLVTVFLNGGNDHLNTLVPAENSAYQAARGGLAVAVDGSTSVGNGLHLHPNLTRLKDRFDAGQVALIEGVGEANDDHSHFSSMATWFAGIAGLPNPTGWLGRYGDGLNLEGLSMVHVGWGGVPMLMRGAQTTPVGLPPNGSLFGADRSENWERFAIDAVSDFGSGGVSGAFGNAVGESFRDAVGTAQQIQPAYSGSLAEEGFARELGLAAEVINLNLGTRVVSVGLGGFDHHDNQRPSHDDLMAELDTRIDAFFSNLSPAFASRTGLLVFSEFGRRVEANGSGTDHGTAGLMMFVGPSAAGGHHGQQPSLTDLDWRGDMHHHVDFRSVYATLLDQWMDADSQEILGANYAPLSIIDSGGAGSVFFDVPGDAYYSPGVAWLASAGITTGTGAGQFSPNDDVTRGQMATFLHRYRGEPSGAPSAGFSDVPSGRYYTEAVDWLADEGITTGVGGNRFAPDDVVTRGQMATFLHRLEGSPGGSPAAGFSDVQPGKFYANAVDWLLYRGITTGVGGNRFAPDDPVTRGQMATFLWRLAGSPA